jgi:uncharacterized protein YbbC (DUF1343 family)
MKLQLATYFDDDTSGITEIEKPPGAHPDSILVVAEGLLEAEKFGKRVSRIGRSTVNPFSVPGLPFVLDEQLSTREDILKTLRVAMSPMKERYKPLFP